MQNLAEFDFTGTDIALFSAGGSVSAEFGPKAASQGCIVIDNTSHFRRETDIPLIVPEVNLHTLAQHKQRNIIANPNCSTIQMVVALKPIHDRVGIERIHVSTYQAVSDRENPVSRNWRLKPRSCSMRKRLKVEVWQTDRV